LGFIVIVLYCHRRLCAHWNEKQRYAQLICFLAKKKIAFIPQHLAGKWPENFHQAVLKGFLVLITSLISSDFLEVKEKRNAVY